MNKEWRCTTKPGKLYIHLFTWPETGLLELHGVKGTIQAARFLTDKKSKLAVTQSGGTVK